METLLERLAEIYAHNPALYQRLLISAVVLLVVWVLRRGVMLAVNRATHDLKARYGWKKLSGYVAFVVAVLAIGGIWLRGLSQVGTYLGLVSAGLAIALRDPLTNIAGWVFLMWRKPFAVGDRIEIGDRAGDVIDIRIFQFSMLEIGGWVDADQSTGRMLHIPNSMLFSQSLANFTRDFPFIWNEVPVLVTFESNWRRAKTLLEEICAVRCGSFAEEAGRYLRRTTEKWFIVYSKLDPIVYTSVLDSGVRLTARFLCPPRQRRSAEDAVWSDILDAFRECADVDFAYPTVRYYDNAREGKPETGPIRE